MTNARHKRQFNYLLKQVKGWKASKQWDTFSNSFIESVYKRLTKMAGKISHLFTPQYVKTLALFLGISAMSLGSSAQTFLPFDSAAFNMQVSNSLAFYRYDPELVDLDADGDLDLLVHELGLKYYENIGTLTTPDFAPPLSNPFNFNPSNGKDIGAVDIDNDGDMDIFSGGGYYGTFSYYENIGDSANPDFAAPLSNQFGINPPYEYYSFYSADFVDIDNDGDLDLFTGAEYGKVFFYENIGSISSPNFAAPIQDPFNISWGVMSGVRQKFVDIDKDGDYDMFAGVSAYSTYGFPILYFENIGTKCAPDFANFQIDAFNLQRPTGTFTAGEELFPAPEFGDMDGDGDEDMFLAYNGAGHIYYFEQDGSGVVPSTLGNNYAFQTTQCDSFNFNGTTYTTSGQYNYTTTSSIGCDSTTTVDLVINLTVSSSETAVICEGEDYTYPDGAIDSNITSATSHLSVLSSSITSCDSLVTTNLAVNPSQQSSESASICEGEGYTYPDGFTETNINTGTSHISTLSSVVTGCDSVVTTSITLNTVDIGTTLSGDTIYASAVGANYQWIDCGANSIVAGETGASFAADETGDYAVEVTENSCVDTSACENITITPTGTQEYNASSIKIWPNPTSRKVFIHLAHTAENGLPIEIRNPLGQVVVSEQLPPGTQFHELDLDQPKGIYFLLIQETVYKIIIE